MDSKKILPVAFLIGLSALVVSVYALIPGVAPNPGHTLDSVAPPAGCAAGQILKWGDPNWICVAEGGGGVPSGVIVMWSGTLATVPAGWHLCDGTAGTPDLRDRFIYGWTAGVNPGGTGGSNTHDHAAGSYTYSLLAHTHGAGSYAMPSHSHRISTGWDIIHEATSEYETLSYDILPDFTDTTGPSGITGSSGPIPLIAPTSTVSGTSGSSSNVPRYYKLAFIMKV